MHSHRYTLIPVLLLAAAAVPHALVAQVRGREPARARPAAVVPLSVAGGDLADVIRAIRGDEPASKRAPVQQLSTGEKAEALRAALDLPAVLPSGIGATVRLTAHKPFAAGQAFIDAYNPVFAGGDKPEGYWTLSPRVESPPAEGLSMAGALFGGLMTPEMHVFFKPAVANKPLILDFAVRLSGNVPVTFTSRVGGGSSSVVQTQVLSGPGDHHVLLVVMPENTGWYSVSLRPERSPGTAETWLEVHYCEITAAK